MDMQQRWPTRLALGCQARDEYPARVAEAEQALAARGQWANANTQGRIARRSSSVCVLDSGSSCREPANGGEGRNDAPSQQRTTRLCRNFPRSCSKFSSPPNQPPRPPLPPACLHQPPSSSFPSSPAYNAVSPPPLRRPLPRRHRCCLPAPKRRLPWRLRALRLRLFPHGRKRRLLCLRSDAHRWSEFQH